MRISIIGVGNVGSALARGWARVGRKIVLGVRDANAPNVQALQQEAGAEIFSPEAAARAGDVIVLALPWQAAESAVKSLGNLSGKIVIDCMNPLGMVDGALGLTIGHATSGAEALQAWAPEARVVKTLNQVGAEIMQDAFGLSARPVMFLAGDDEEAKQRVGTLVEALGFEALDAGPLRQARLLEPLAMVWINQALFRGAGRAWAFSRATGQT
jgi:NADPH-dependent F420 reductase